MTFRPSVFLFMWILCSNKHLVRGEGWRKNITNMRRCVLKFKYDTHCLTHVTSQNLNTCPNIFKYIEIVTENRRIIIIINNYIQKT